MQYDGDHRHRLVGYFGYSLTPNYDYDGHPRFDAFASGLMAYEHTPLELRCDRELQRDYPPRPLEGLCDEKLYWRSSEQITWDRDMLRRAEELEAER
jgi:hypothetical protein